MKKLLEVPVDLVRTEGRSARLGRLPIRDLERSAAQGHIDPWRLPTRHFHGSRDGLGLPLPIARSLQFGSR
jgi:hypothetical protein